MRFAAYLRERESLFASTASSLPRALSIAMPHYSGVTFVQTWVADAERRHPELARFVGPGNIMALGDSKALMAQRNGDGHIRVYVGLRVREDWTERCGFDLTDPSAARAGLLALFGG